MPMAENKKTFIFYSDWINMINEMPDNDAGQLLKHILSYVNDESPSTENILVKMAFAHMKPLLKADLVKWDNIRQKRVEYGKKGGQAKAKQKLAKAKQVEAVNDNVNVNVNVNVNDNKKKGLIFPFDSSEFKNHWDIWKGYKKGEHRFTYKTLVSEQAALKKLSEISTNETNAIKIIHQSIENGWKGFFELKENGNTKNKNGVRNFTAEGVIKAMEESGLDVSQLKPGN